MSHCAGRQGRIHDSIRTSNVSVVVAVGGSGAACHEWQQEREYVRQHCDVRMNG